MELLGIRLELLGIAWALSAQASRAPTPPAPPRIMASEALALVSGARGGGSAPPPTSPVLTCEENQRLREELREYAEDLSQVLKERGKLRTALEKAEGENYQLKIKLWEAEYRFTSGTRYSA